jgi:Ca2+-binding EF-hand superfamily protein
MGNAGSYTAKAHIKSQLYIFTQWGSRQLSEFLIRGQQELSETFGIRRHEFEHLVNAEEIGLDSARSLFHEVFDTDRNGLVDKMEVMCIVCMTTKVSTREKIEFFFDLFNFNNKGYLNESEMTLLMMAVSRGAFKVDQKFHPPQAKLIKELVTKAFQKYTKAQPGCLRKPELVQFAIDNSDIAAFLECWRGHAAQVLLNTDEKWRDLSFPCNELSVAPSKVWYKLGVPPPFYVKWRRRDKIGIQGMTKLFSHTETFLKTVDRKRVFKGEGILGTGCLKQGCLADLWLLNAMAATTIRPDLLFYLFAPTGQEDEGRYCVRFYEGGGWRSVYVDDRIPCGLDVKPLFAKSSSESEAWVSIMEKAMAKYLGSFGHVALCGQRNDACLTSLRHVTGGHVMRLSVRDYEWHTVGEDCLVKEDGNGFVMSCLREGSVVTFGRSAGTTLTPIDPFFTINTSKNSAAAHLPPIGHVFPVLGQKFVGNYLFYILKDPWGLIGDVDADVNPDTGQSNTFLIRVEDVPSYYDTIIVSRYPDSLRTSTEKYRLAPWTTEVRQTMTKGRQHPAAFRITVRKKAQVSNSGGMNAPTHKLKKKKYNPVISEQQIIDKILTQSDQMDDEDDHEFRLKDRYDFSRNALAKQGYTTPGAHRKDLAQLEKEKREKAKEQAAKQKKAAMSCAKKLLDKKDDLVHVCMTLSSACDWSFAGSDIAGAELRARLFPSLDTLRGIAYRRKKLETQFAEEERQQKEQEKKQAELLEVDTDERDAALQSHSSAMTTDGAAQLIMQQKGLVTLDGRQQNDEMGMKYNSGINDNMHITSPRPSSSETDHLPRIQQQQQQQVPAGAKPTALLQVRRPLSSNQQQALQEAFPVDPKSFDLSIAAQRSWTAHAMDLVPGEYFLVADISFAMSYIAAKMRSLPRDVAEAPWLEPSLIEAFHQNLNYFDAEAAALRSQIETGGVDLEGGSIADGDSLSHRSVTSLAQLEKKIFKFEQALQAQPALAGMISGDDLAQVHARLKSGQQPVALTKEDILHLEHPIWLEATTTDEIQVVPIYFEDLKQMDTPMHAFTPLFPPSIPDEVWPFCPESQEEVAGRVLMNTMTSLREEAESLGEEFIHLANKYKDERKRILLARQQQKNASS